jgi:hypothetical protein
VPLSEREQREFEALEQTISSQDPAFAHRVRVESARLPHSRLPLAILGLLAGLGLLAWFCLTTVVVIGVAGFLVLFASSYQLWVRLSLGRSPRRQRRRDRLN